MFKWTCFAAALLFAVALLALVNELRRDVTTSLETAETAVSQANQAVSTVNDQLPEIIAEVRKGTETLSELAEDVELIKSIAGMPSGEDRGFRGLATYADELQRVFAEQTAGSDAVILIEEVFGSDLKKHATAEEFLVGLNREMITLILPLAKSKQEILYRVTHSAPPRRKPFFIQFGDEAPSELEAFFKQHHPASAELSAYKPE